MPAITRSTDAEGRISLPKAFADTKVIIKQVSATELRIRKAQAGSKGRVRFREELATVLSNRDRDLFLALLDNPPPASKALRRAAAQYKKRRHG